MVDSGADGTLLPKSVAGDLGLDPATDLVQDAGSGGAGGISFATWTTQHAITGQVVANPPNGSPVLWGPVMTLKPRFAEAGMTLFGRSDFFSYFSISFVTDPTHGPVFLLAC
jgi:hypothetical protein